MLPNSFFNPFPSTPQISFNFSHLINCVYTFLASLPFFFLLALTIIHRRLLHCHSIISIKLFECLNDQKNKKDWRLLERNSLLIVFVLHGHLELNSFSSFTKQIYPALSHSLSLSFCHSSAVESMLSFKWIKLTLQQKVIHGHLTDGFSRRWLWFPLSAVITHTRTHTHT